VHTLTQDLRFSSRMLLKSPGFATVAVLSLALGIGANSTMFSVLNALVYRPLPYKNPDQLMMIWETDQKQPGFRRPAPLLNVLDWKEQNHVFEDIGLTTGDASPRTLSGLGEAERILAQGASANFFGLLGVKPALGRVFLTEEVRGRAQTVVISDLFWKRRFNRNPNALGKTFDDEGTMCTTVGVMPPGFEPFYGDRIDIWEPMDPASTTHSKREDHYLMAIGRLKPGVTLRQAQLEMDVIARRLERAYPAVNKGVGVKVLPLHAALFGWAPRMLAPLLGVVGFVLLIACANVANLLLARTQTRRKEFVVRASLGAGRARLIRQLLVESGLLALVGGSLGVLLAVWGIKLFRQLAGEFPYADSVSIDGRVLLFTLAASLLSGILFGLAPALHGSSPDLNSALKEGERRTATGSRGITRKLLVISEVALALVLLVGAGLMINSMVRLQHVDPGFNPTKVLTMETFLSESGYVEHVPGGVLKNVSPQATTFYQQLLQRIENLPGVESVGMIGQLPTRWEEPRTFVILGHPVPEPDKRPEAGYNEVSPSFFHTMQIPLKKGRFLNERDTASAPWAVIINEAMARRYFPNEDPIGQLLRLRFEPYAVEESQPRVIVGIMGDVKHGGLDSDAPAGMYVSYLQQPSQYPGGRVVGHLRHDLVIRTGSGVTGSGANFVASVKRIVAELDKDQPVTDIMTTDEVLSRSISGQRFYMQLLGIVGGLALLLAAVGIYGVMSYSVTERTHEIGIRVALGARRTDVLRLVVNLGLKLTLIGVAAGVLVALGLTRLITGFLFGVKATDPLTYALISSLLVGVAVLACYLPARRATKVDPMVALRYE